jgi:hypothetical protein
MIPYRDSEPLPGLKEFYRTGNGEDVQLEVSWLCRFALTGKGQGHRPNGLLRPRMRRSSLELSTWHATTSG